MSHELIKQGSDQNSSGRFDGKRNLSKNGVRKSHNINKNSKKQMSTVKPLLGSIPTCNEMLLPNSDHVQDSVISMVTSARILLKKPLDYTALNEVHSSCKQFMKTLENTIESLSYPPTVDDTPEECNREQLDSDSSENEKYKKSKRKLTNVEESDQLCSTAKSSEHSPIKKPKLTVVSDCDDLNEIEVIKKEHLPVQHTNVSIESPHILFSPLTASNTWELLQLKRMLQDPFLSVSRKQCLNTRLLELNESIISELIGQSEKSKNSEIFVLERLCAMSADRTCSPDQKDRIDCILSAFREKVIKDIAKSIIDPEGDYECTIQKLNAIIKIPCISDTEKVDFMSKMIDLRSKLSNDLIKRTNASTEDGTKILEKIKNLVDDPLLSDRARSRLLSYVGFVRNKSIQILTAQPVSEPENNGDLIKKLGSLLQDSLIPYGQRMKVLEKLQICESTVQFKLKRSKQKLKETIMASANETLGFEGTNLDFIFGYSMDTPSFVRCIKVWNPKESL